MYPGGYTVEVTSLSPKATEKDVSDFFAHCGATEHVEIIRSGEYACTAYVTFKDAYALETAILLSLRGSHSALSTVVDYCLVTMVSVATEFLKYKGFENNTDKRMPYGTMVKYRSGATIVDQRICILRWGSYIDEYDPSWKHEYNTSSTTTHASQFVSTPGEAVTVAQEVVTTMLAKGYVLGKDALIKAKALDESFQVSATAAAKIAELSNRIGLTDKINAVKSVDEKYHVSETTISAATVTGRTAYAAATATGRTAAAAATAVVNSSYFAQGALWVSDVLTRASKVAANMGNHSNN